MSEQISTRPSTAVAEEPTIPFGPNCLLGICCPPPRQLEQLASLLASELGWSAHKDDKSTGNAYAAAECVLKHFDLAPHGTTALFRKVAEIAAGP